MRPRAQPLLLHRPLQQPLRIRRQLAVRPYLLRPHLRVRIDLPRRRPSPLPFVRSSGLRKPLMLPLPRRQHPLPYLRRTLRRRPPRNSLYCTAGTSIWMSIRSSSGPRHLGHIPLDHRRRTHALPRSCR